MDWIFAIWPTLGDMARDVGMPYPTVSSWKQRGIPAKHDPLIIAAAAKRGVSVTFEELHHARRELREDQTDRGAA